MQDKVSKYNININNAEVFHLIESNNGNIVGKYVKEQSLPEAVKEIQQLLDYLAKTYPVSTDNEKAAAIKQIEQKPELKAKIVGALEKGGEKALEKFLDHPATAVAIAVYKGWREAK